MRIQANRPLDMHRGPALWTCGHAWTSKGDLLCGHPDICAVRVWTYPGPWTPGEALPLGHPPHGHAKIWGGIPDTPQKTKERERKRSGHVAGVSHATIRTWMDMRWGREGGGVWSCVQ